MNILGIETSCDETAAAVVKDGTAILASVVSSQVEVHRRYGGVVPELASRKHLEAIVPVVDEAMDKAGLPLTEIEAPLAQPGIRKGQPTIIPLVIFIFRKGWPRHKCCSKITSRQAERYFDNDYKRRPSFQPLLSKPIRMNLSKRITILNQMQ